MKTLIERHTAVLPHRRSSHLVTCGPFRLTRNPIYLGYTIMMVGCGLITLNPWFFITASLAVALTTAFAVRKEDYTSCRASASSSSAIAVPPAGGSDADHGVAAPRVKSDAKDAVAL